MSKIKAFLSQKKIAELFASLILISVFILPALSLASDKKIYVDSKASGASDGSVSHPYKTINEALKNAKKDTEIHIAKGTYEESFTLKEGVEIYGEDRDEVIIKSPKKKYAVVTMGKNTRIDGVTIRDGKYGILVKDDGKVTIVDCVIKNNEKGILIHDAEVKKSKEVSITDSLIEKNDKEGIYAEARRVVLINNQIKNNEGDGVLFLAGVSAWINKTTISHNDKSGMKLTLDRADVWVKKSRFSSNDREGVEINAYGAYGKVDFNDSKFLYNGRWGIAKVQRGNFSYNLWKGVTIQSNNLLSDNGSGNVSPVIKIN